MKVLMIARSTHFSAPGGDSTQIEMTAKYLRELGVEVDLKLSNQAIAYEDYDLLHFFNIIRPDDILPHAQATAVPFVISTIFVDYSEYERKCRTGPLRVLNMVLNRDQLEYAKALARAVKNGDAIKSRYFLLHGQRKSVQHLASRAAMLLPNSHHEYQRLTAAYQVDKRYQKVVNAIDPSLFGEGVVANPAFEGHVLCVGRIEGLKNQLNLIQAVLGTSLQLTIVGKPAPNHMAYYEQCQRLAQNAPNVQFIPHMDHRTLAGLYKAAKVHVLPSWFETTGLSSLEAGALGCNLVVTRKGDTEEYFGDMAYYCEPDDVESIRGALLQAHTEPVNARLKDHIFSHYTWQDTAAQTLAAYQQVLNP
ncbi:glycosyltransferase family 4 protein [Hymenobacter sp. BT770]|uniref:glycosyltransferase family 4 protein n=1 Tax=Hymenobacter sp. BT770 TaxID=2886942 RepID=UPI001D124749|nr:glycosyltransferase family 4 protein [Hymenobacter sp. BT770]MCC3152803.1 glycosyltransferase family 4 protein [Hymenobacter sp. BT770]MDO3414878.1 glycosyltransferase family 4 protein [Hymenobacter sp. BT770]